MLLPFLTLPDETLTESPECYLLQEGTNTKKRNPTINLLSLQRNYSSHPYSPSAKLFQGVTWPEQGFYGLYIHRQTELTVPLLFSHLIWCLLGVTELQIQVTEVSPIQMQWFGTVHLGAYKAHVTHFMRCCLKDHFTLQLPFTHFSHAHETLIYFAFQSYIHMEWQNSIF